MRVHIGTDHAGFELKNRLVTQLEKKGHEVTDHGAHEYDALDDYPPFCTDVGEAVVAQPGSLGIVIGGSGNGEQIAANKVAGVRAALVWNEETARLAREHNDANVISVGARQHSEEELEALIDLFLAEPFSGEERHQRRIDLVARYETTGGYSEDQGAGADAR
ncbi:ribose-5-phosphate isomerase [Brachybacterium paraconglomeratum]|uniref:ribose-5-phosphate isomerase n=1 Tax=Brachybacterium TaxID=43668 RepID=UPI0006B467C9|nr:MULTISPECIES: ribose-5-phosphate isomerase [Brachybacterium]MCZ4324980.1 ribose-5-phosphate isomerase [Brachybacterium paraconglomeratum]GAP80416.1 ribose 5-phosphate isomerase B [Brachybacterium sp. SW0106-09]